MIKGMKWWNSDDIRGAPQLSGGCLMVLHRKYHDSLQKRWQMRSGRTRKEEEERRGGYKRKHSWEKRMRKKVDEKISRSWPFVFQECTYCLSGSAFGSMSELFFSRYVEALVTLIPCLRPFLSSKYCPTYTDFQHRYRSYQFCSRCLLYCPFTKTL